MCALKGAGQGWDSHCLFIQGEANSYAMGKGLVSIRFTDSATRNEPRSIPVIVFFL